MKSTAPIIIVGTGMAGYSLAREYRKLDQSAELILISADDGRSYSKPMLSTGFTKQKTADELSMADPVQMREQLSAQILTMTRVLNIEPETNCIQVQPAEGDEQLIEYSSLVLACGAEVVEPPIKGNGLDRVYTINDLMDYARFRKAALGRKRIVIIGAGLIGCEFANDLTNGGYQVEVVDPMPHLLPTFLTEEPAMVVARSLVDLGVRFRFGALVQSVDRCDAGVNVTLSDGEVISADLVISAVGLRPRVNLAKEAGIAVNRGIVTDRFLRTNHDNVYAMGDCAEVEGHVMLFVMPLMAAAKTLARTLCGDETPVAYPAMPIVIKIPACPVVVSVPPEDASGTWTFDVEGNNVKALYRDGSGQLLGFSLTGSCCKERMVLSRELPDIISAGSDEKSKKRQRP
jgi:rubredoxin-NAD+ reductase